MIGINNPLNIRYVKRNNWKGQTGSTRGFCDFESVDYCIRAFGILVLRSYKKRGVCTIAQIIKTYAPPSENDTDKYIEFVCGKLNCFPFDVPSNIYMFAKLVSVMALFESSYILNELHIVLVLCRFGLSKLCYYE